MSSLVDLRILLFSVNKIKPRKNKSGAFKKITAKKWLIDNLSNENTEKMAGPRPLLLLGGTLAIHATKKGP